MKSLVIPVILVSLSLIGLGALVGCGSVSSRPNIEDIYYGYQGYNDMPVPQDFVLDETDRTWAFRRYENSALNLRCGRFRYTGDRDVGQLVNWYNEQMAQHEWRQVSKDKDDAGLRATLVFTKKTEEAKVEIERLEGPNHPEPYTVVLLTLGVGQGGS